MGGGYAWLAELTTITCTLTNCKGDSDSYAGEADDSLETDSELRNMKKQVFFFFGRVFFILGSIHFSWC